jgi:uncharacterized protein
VILSAGMPEKVVVVAGEELIARADASLYWPARSTLFVADVHLGKAASFRAAAVPVPVGTTAATLSRLGSALEQTGASRLVYLGDLWHAKEGRKEEILASLRLWRHSFPHVEMLLVEGNHDRRSGALPPDLGIATVLEPHRDEPFGLCHYPCELSDSYCLAGHIHPSVCLSARGRQSMRLPCFWFGQRTAVLPAFGDFTGMAEIAPAPGDQVFVIAENRLHSVTLEEPTRSRAPSV